MTRDAEIRADLERQWAESEAPPIDWADIIDLYEDAYQRCVVVMTVDPVHFRQRRPFRYLPAPPLRRRP